MINPADGIIAAARIIREGEPIYAGPVTRYQLRQGDQILHVDVISGHEAETLRLADERAAELAGSKA